MRLFRLPEYDAAAAGLAYRWIDRRTTDHAPSLRLFPRRDVEMEMVRTSRTTGSDGSELRIEPVPRRGGGTFGIREVVKGDFNQIRETLDEAAKERAQVMVSYWQANVDRGVGAGVISKGHGALSWDSLIDQLETLDIGFDEAGNPQFKLVLGTGAAGTFDALPPPDDDQRRRWEILVEKKREAWRARQRRRRLA